MTPAKDGMTLLEVLAVASLLALLAGLVVGRTITTPRQDAGVALATWQAALRDGARARGGESLQWKDGAWQSRQQDAALLPPAGAAITSADGEQLRRIDVDAQGFTIRFRCRLDGRTFEVDPFSGELSSRAGPQP